MAMSEAAKKRVPKSKRGVPSKSGTGSYPMATAKERGEAKALAAMHHGKNSAFTKRIDAKADRLSSAKGSKKDYDHAHAKHSDGHVKPRTWNRDRHKEFWG